MNHKLDTDARVFFYEQDFYVLSNFSAFRVIWRGRDFDTSEAAYHWERFATGQEGQSPYIGAMAWVVADEIRFAPSAHEAFRLAQEKRDLQRSDWDAIKVAVMRNILRAKANQHEYVRRKLLATGERELIEDSWRDDFWGWGQNRDGRNMLGVLWMQIRSELRGVWDAAAREPVTCAAVSSEQTTSPEHAISDPLAAARDVVEAEQREPDAPEFLLRKNGETA